MKITFVSNYINHHQIPFCQAMQEVIGEGYTFIQTQPMEEERVKMGWQLDKELPYVKYAYEEPVECQKLVMDSDIVIWGGAEDETMLKPRLEACKPVIRYSERLYRTGQWKAISPRGLRKKYQDHIKYRKAPVYLLCAGAYVASDFQIIHAYPQKRYKWGYFPASKEYDIEALLKDKERADGKVEILWVARFIPLKHPELMVGLAEKLREAGKAFHITMIGGGVLKASIEEQIREKHLEEYISLTGTMSPEEVRGYMEKASVFLMTSDKQEGWGAVINEAMNSGCAVIANRLIGAVPFLIEHGVNGYQYRKGEAKELAELVIPLLESKALRQQIGAKAYETIAKEWNAKEAVQRLLQICQNVVDGKEPQIIWETGPCSRAEVIKERS